MKNKTTLTITIFILLFNPIPANTNEKKYSNSYPKTHHHFQKSTDKLQKKITLEYNSHNQIITKTIGVFFK